LPVVSPVGDNVVKLVDMASGTALSAAGALTGSPEQANLWQIPDPALAEGKPASHNDS